MAPRRRLSRAHYRPHFSTGYCSRPGVFRAGAERSRAHIGSLLHEGEEEAAMNYFVTGATGFIGRHLVEQLLKRDGTIHALVREGSRGKVDDLIDRLGAAEGRIVPVNGDLTKPGLGVEGFD